MASDDVNNDEAKDLVIGARFADPGGRTDAGGTYALFGPLGGGTLELPTEADISINGIDAGDGSGGGVATGGRQQRHHCRPHHRRTHRRPCGRNGCRRELRPPRAAGRRNIGVVHHADISINNIDAGDRSGGGVATGPLHKGNLLLRTHERRKIRRTRRTRSRSMPWRAPMIPSNPAGPGSLRTRR